MAVKKQSGGASPEDPRRRRRKDELPEDRILRELFGDITPERLGKMHEKAMAYDKRHQGQLRYHETVFFSKSTKPPERLTALSALAEGDWNFKGGDEARRKLVGRLMGEYGKPVEVALKAELTYALLMLGMDNQPVRENVMADLMSGNAEPAVVGKGLNAVDMHVTWGTPAFVEAYGSRLKGMLRDLVMKSENPTVLSSAIGTMVVASMADTKEAMESPESGIKALIPLKDIKDDAELVERLKILSKSGDGVLSVTSASLLDSIGIDAIQSFEDAGRKGRANPMLDAAGKTELANIISEADEPADYVGMLLRGKTIVFAGIKHPYGYPPRHIEEMVTRLGSQYGLTHLALPYSAFQAELLGEALRGRNKDMWLWGLAGNEIIKPAGEKREILSETLKLLRRLQKKVKFLYYGSTQTSEQDGELFMDGRVRPLLETVENGGRVLALGTVDYTAKVDVVSPTMWQSRSLPSWIGTKGGVTTATVVLYQTDEATMMDRDIKLNNVQDAVELVASRTGRRAFGLPVTKPLSGLRYDVGTDATYGEACDGVILEVARDTGEGDRARSSRPRQRTGSPLEMLTLRT
ncbi:MAG: hypothetical protein PHG85_05325 [Candidatus Altiarchaeota archaeon]|nr:hypothetical protein [Candidatus Altiarchaeota archaeon]